MSEDVAKFIEIFEAEIRSKPNYAYNLAGLAAVIAHKKNRVQAFELARRAMAAAGGDPRARMRARAVLASLIHGYHVPMMNDAARNAAWDGALRRAIRPGMHVFEIGTGAGMLAMMAARAGATVTTCETHPIAARLARELAARNGFAGKIDVIEKSSREVQLSDMPRRADLLFCDIFGDSLFNFEPLPLVADAQKRLAMPGAAVLPRNVSLQAALGWSPELSTEVGDTCGFDLAPMRDFVASATMLKIGDPDIRVLGPAQQVFAFDFSGPSEPASVELRLTMARAGETNGVLRWIRLLLDDEAVLEARPAVGRRFFSSPTFFPFGRKIALGAGDALQVGFAHQAGTLENWLVDAG